MLDAIMMAFGRYSDGAIDINGLFEELASLDPDMTVNDAKDYLRVYTLVFTRER